MEKLKTYTEVAFSVLRRNPAAKIGKVYYRCTELDITLPEREEQNRIYETVGEILRLESEVHKLKNELEEINNNPPDQAVIKNWEADFEELNAEREELEKERAEVHKLKSELNYKLSEEYWKPTQNERNAGRKPKITDKFCEDVRRRKKAGETYRAIAKSLGVSVGLVHKAFNVH